MNVDIESAREAGSIESVRIGVMSYSFVVSVKTIVSVSIGRFLENPLFSPASCADRLAINITPSNNAAARRNFFISISFLYANSFFPLVMFIAVCRKSPLFFPVLLRL